MEIKQGVARAMLKARLEAAKVKQHLAYEAMLGPVGHQPSKMLVWNFMVACNIAMELEREYMALLGVKGFVR